MFKHIARWTSIAALLAAPAAVPGPAAAEDGKGFTTVRLEVPKGWTSVSRIVVDRSTRRPITDYTVRTETTSTKQYSVLTVPGTSTTDYCEIYASPAPTYSAFGHTMQWGAQIICNVVAHLRIRMGLWSGPTTSQYQDSTPWKYKVGSSHSDNKSKPCVDWSGFTYWELDPYGEVDWDFNENWIPFVPYPGDVPLRWQECLDIA